MDARSLSKLPGASSQVTRTPTILPELHCTICLKSPIPNTPWFKQGNGWTILCNALLGQFLASNITWSRLDCLCSEGCARQVSRSRPKLHLLPLTEAFAHAWCRNTEPLVSLFTQRCPLQIWVFDRGFYGPQSNSETHQTMEKCLVPRQENLQTCT